MGTNYTQWRAPLEDVDAKLNYSQLPLPNQQYNTSQLPAVPTQRYDCPVVDSHPRMDYYYSNSTPIIPSAWSNERHSGQGQYWQHRH